MWSTTPGAEPGDVELVAEAEPVSATPAGGIAGQVDAEARAVWRRPVATHASRCSQPRSVIAHPPAAYRRSSLENAGLYSPPQRALPAAKKTVVAGDTPVGVGVQTD